VPDTARADWLANLANLQISPDYARAFARWKSSFSAPGHTLLEFTLASRLLIGHGLPSAAEVGLTVHHTWGAPMIPGSALKGLCAHYTVSNFGPDAPEAAPWSLNDPEAAERAGFQGVTWDPKKKTRIEAGPGWVYRALYGAPDAARDEEWNKAGKGLWPAGAARGGVTFHDALYIPGSIAEDKPFKEDVLTVHQKEYYKAAGKLDQPWPNDYDSPNPVAFLTIRPKAKFLIALSGDEDAAKLAADILKAALAEWGVGGKTSLGYGRGDAQTSKEWGATLP